MSDYARRHLVCSSWHNAPDGFQGWSGSMGGWSKRPFCTLGAGHAGDHQAHIEPVTQTPGFAPVRVPFTVGQEMTWPNALGMPDWLVETTLHGIEMMRDHGLDPCNPTSSAPQSHINEEVTRA